MGARKKQRSSSSEKGGFTVPVEKEFLRTRAVEQLRFNGFKPGRVVCIDNLGWGFDLESLRDQILSHLPTAKDVRFSVLHSPYLGRTYYGGWGCVEFDSYQEAVKSLETLDFLFIKVPNCPVPRPVIAHFPRWVDYPCEVDGEAIDCGSLRGGKQMTSADVQKPFAAHFAQLNNMGALGLEWAEKDEVCKEAKEVVKDGFRTILVNTLKEVLGRSQDGAVEGGNSKEKSKKRCTPLGICEGKNIKRGSSCGEDPIEPCTLWIRGVSSSVKTEEVEQWFKQFDNVNEIVRGEDPVSKQPSGHVMITVEREDQAKLLMHQLDISLLLVGVVRPLRIQFATGLGGPTGFEALFDEALIEACGFDMGTCAIDEHVVVHQNDLEAKEVEISVACRKVLDRCSLERAAAFKEASKARGELHIEQENAIFEECRKLEYLNKHIPKATPGSARRNVNEGKRDGRRLRARRSLHDNKRNTNNMK